MSVDSMVTVNDEKGAIADEEDDDPSALSREEVTKIDGAAPSDGSSACLAEACEKML